MRLAVQFPARTRILCFLVTNGEAGDSPNIGCVQFVLGSTARKQGSLPYGHLLGMIASRLAVQIIYPLHTNIKLVC